MNPYLLGNIIGFSIIIAIDNYRWKKLYNNKLKEYYKQQT